MSSWNTYVRQTECQGQRKECCPLQAQILQQPLRPALILPFGRADGRAIVMKGCCRHPPSVPRSRLVVHLKVDSHCSVAAAWPIPNLNTRKSSLIGLLLLSLFMNPPFVDTPYLRLLSQSPIFPPPATSGLLEHDLRKSRHSCAYWLMFWGLLSGESSELAS